MSFVDFLKSLGNLSEPMLEMSMLSGIQDALDAVTYSENKVQGIAFKIATGYISQFIPTLFGQIERAFTEDTRQSTFVDKTSETPNIERFIGNTMNKLPGEYNQMDYIDAWGRTQSTGNLAQRTVNNFLNPTYVSDKRTTEVETELQRLYDAGYGDVLPSGAAYSTKVEGEYLTKEQYTKYATTKGQTSLALVEKFMRMPAYSKMSDAAKNDAIKDIYDYATDEAKLAVDRNADVSAWHKEAKASGNAAKYIADRAEYKEASNGGGDSIKDRVTALQNGYDEQKVYDMWVNDDGKPVEQRDKYDAMNGALADKDKVSLKSYLSVYDYKVNLHTPEDVTDKNWVKQHFYDYLAGQSDLSATQKDAIFLSFYKDYKGVE